MLQLVNTRMRISILILCILLLLLFCGCSQNSQREENISDSQTVEITVFAAKSLNKVLDELICRYRLEHDDVKFTVNYDGSGTLMTQIEEGADCDIFFSASEKEMDELFEKNLIETDTRKDVISNQLCVVTYKGSGSRVSGIADLNLAKNLAIADGSVPAGKYTRRALIKCGILKETVDAGKITTREMSEALNGVEINECVNVGAVASCVSEGANEVGTIYYSDTFQYDDKLEIIEKVPLELTGDIIYPAACVKKPFLDMKQKMAAQEFIEYLTKEEAQEIFEDYKFIIIQDR